MKARITNQPADICTRKVVIYRNDRPFIFFLPPTNSHRNTPCYCGSGKKYKRCCGVINNDSTNN
jgi:uncharacterized protein YchJ